MSNFIPEKLSVEYMDGVTANEPVFPRCYTLTHSDLTGQLFLSIGFHYAWDKINPKRDEVLGEWNIYMNSLYYKVYLYIDQGEYSHDAAAKRVEVFKRELPLALKAIHYGDRFLFNTYPHLNHAAIIVNFNSAYPQFARQENWGTFQSISNKT
ncbi:staygreen family protein [Neobacillus niacini]|uniref:staygreen family protein n=1 Tax=Neobacillus niacini TaxID=86668 RepID=UPI001C8D9EC8|nr:staygreen family protein [Neobacillus niacini]MBY0148701.1 staygreen family protein [Neobacillus niacini]